MANRRKSHVTKKTKNGRYVANQFYTNIPLCEEDHVYGMMDLLGPLCIPGKVCLKCTHIIYKDEVVKKRELLRETILKSKPHIDLFHF